ncbi:MAG: biopolymer transporter ExbD [Nostocaceae cyanobacterium]|nr:biopolymer transporter ExbD [Nostocaceae cyanobacterium]
MKINLHSPLEEVQIQIIPLIDVVFCILTFFLLAALQFTRQQAINVDLPKAGTGTSSQAREILPVTIDAVGQLYVEKNPIKKEQLMSALRTYLQQNPNGTLVLNASRTATYNDVVQVLDMLRQVGGNRVALAIIPGSADQPTNPATVPPSVPNNPGTLPTPGLPNSSPFSNSNPLGNPNLPPAPQVPLPSGQGVNPINPSIPVVPTAPAPQPGIPTSGSPQAPVAPGATNSAPRR